MAATFDTDYMKKHIKYCQKMSMWPMQEEGRLRHFYYHLSVTILATTLCLLVGPLILKIVTHFSDVDGVATVIDFATVAASGTFRYIYVYLRAAKYDQLIDFMKTKFTHESFSPFGVKMSMDKFVKLGSWIGIIYSFGAAFWILQMCFVPLFSYLIRADSAEKKLPMVFEASYPFDISVQPNHAFAYLFQVLGFSLLGYVYLLIDSFWYMAITLTIGQLIIINHSLRNLNITLKEGNETVAEEELDKCIKQHQVTREFIHQIEDLMSPNVLVDFMHAVLSITFILLDFTIALNNSYWLKALHLLEYFAVSIVHMFLFDYLGTELVTREEDLAEAVYDTPWYEMSKTFRKKVHIMSMLARNPFRLTGGRMYHMSLQFFVGTIKMIFSYFMFLFQLRNGL